MAALACVVYRLTVLRDHAIFFFVVRVVTRKNSVSFVYDLYHCFLPTKFRLLLLLILKSIKYEIQKQ